MTIFNGIDVSKHQGSIDWAKVKKDNIHFAMLRATAGSTYVDTKLSENIKGCEENGIDYGLYHYSYAKSVDEIKKEAEFFIDTIKAFYPTYPVVLDLEDSSQKPLGRKVLTDMAVAFMSMTEDANYYSMLYTNKNWLNYYLEKERLERFDKWIADWTGRKPDYTDYGIWQYSVLGSSSDVEKSWAVTVGSVDGISTPIDVNYSYKNYPDIIKGHNLNKPSQLYRVTAEKEKLFKKDADSLADELKAIGMKVNKELMQ